MDRSEREQFARAVYDIARLVPPGRATSYGAIARAVGAPSHSRLVGRVMSECGDDVPAHRVVNSQGVLSAAGAFDVPGRMQRLLESEGVAVASNRIRNWKAVFWDPLREI